MAVPAIVWRNPKTVRRVRRWTHVRRDDSRSLYLVLESRAKGKMSWDGLPSLEILKSHPARPKAEDKKEETRKWHFLPWGS
jgi:hypothetical protein